MKLPEVFILGAMRSGTTWLARTLESHPRVFLPQHKEVHFFDRNFDKGLDWYAGQFEGAGPDQLLCDATPNYLYHPLVPERLEATVPQARLIVVVRNPIDRAYSHYLQRRSYGTEALPFGRAIDAEQERIARSGLDRDLYSYCDRGKYLSQIRRYLERFPRERLLVLVYERLFAAPEPSYRAVCEFLGLEPGSLPPTLNSRINETLEFRSPALRNLSRKFPRPIRNLIAKVNARPASYDPVDPAVRARLRAHFRDDNRALGEWLGEDLVGLWT